MSIVDSIVSLTEKEELSSSSVAFILFILSLLFVTPPILSEALFGGNVPKTIWYIRIIDIVDITIMTGVYIVLFTYLEHISVSRTDNLILRKVYQLGFVLFIGGHFMHFAANAINTYAFEVAGYVVGTDIPEDIAALIYFFDEELSHFIMFTTLFTMLLVVLLARVDLYDGKSGYKFNLVDRILIFVATLIFGGAFSISAIEARKAYLVIALEIIVLIMFALYTKYWAKKNMLGVIRNDSLVRIMIGALIFSLLIFIAYYVYFGYFIQPSELFRKHTY